jgi:hypothetical protein
MQATTSLSLTSPAMTCLPESSRLLTTSQLLMRVEAPVARGLRDTPRLRFAMLSRRPAGNPRRDHQPSERFWSPFHRYGGEAGQAVCRLCMTDYAARGRSLAMGGCRGAQQGGTAAYSGERRKPIHRRGG